MAKVYNSLYQQDTKSILSPPPRNHFLFSFVFIFVDDKESRKKRVTSCPGKFYFTPNILRKKFNITNFYPLFVLKPFFFSLFTFTSFYSFWSFFFFPFTPFEKKRCNEEVRCLFCVIVYFLFFFRITSRYVCLFYSNLYFIKGRSNRKFRKITSTQSFFFFFCCFFRYL